MALDGLAGIGVCSPDSGVTQLLGQVAMDGAGQVQDGGAVVLSPKKLAKEIASELAEARATYKEQ